MVVDFAAAIEWASLLERYAQRSSLRRRLPRVGMKTGLTAREKVTLNGRALCRVAYPHDRLTACVVLLREAGDACPFAQSLPHLVLLFRGQCGRPPHRFPFRLRSRDTGLRSLDQ